MKLNPPPAGNRPRLFPRDAKRAESVDDRVERVDAQRKVLAVARRFIARAHGTDVQFATISKTKPRTVFGEGAWLVNLFKLEQFAVEANGLGLAAGRAEHLHMVKRCAAHVRFDFRSRRQEPDFVSTITLLPARRSSI